MIKEPLYRHTCMSIELAERIDHAIKGSKYSKAEIARKLGVTPQAVNGWTKKGKISKDALIDLSNLLSVNPNYLLFGYETDSNEFGFGKGEMSLFLSDDEYDMVAQIAKDKGISVDDAVQVLFESAAKDLLHANTEQNGNYIGHVDAWDSQTPLSEDEAELPFFMDVELAAGIGGELAQENNGYKLRFSRSTLRKCGVDPSNAACVKVSGNSMEPRLYDGDVVGVDLGNKRIVDGKTYAINHDGLLRVKRLYRLPGGGIRINSMNTSEHPDELYDAEQRDTISIIGRVFWHSSIWY